MSRIKTIAASSTALISLTLAGCAAVGGGPVPDGLRVIEVASVLEAVQLSVAPVG